MVTHAPLALRAHPYGVGYLAALPTVPSQIAWALRIPAGAPTSTVLNPSNINTNGGSSGPEGPGDPHDPRRDNPRRREDPHVRLRRTNDALRRVLDQLDGVSGWPRATGEERRQLERLMYRLADEVASLLDETAPSSPPHALNDGEAEDGRSVA